MVAKPNRLAEARKAIHRAIDELLEGNDVPRVSFRETEWGHLSVLVGSDRFKGVSEDDRDDLIWDCLESRLSPADFGQVAEISVFDNAEYEGFTRMERWINRSGGGIED